MKQIKILSQKEYLLTELAQLLQARDNNQATKTTKQTVNTVGDAFLELVRIHMREMAREPLPFNKAEELVEQAIAFSLAELSLRLNEDSSALAQLFDRAQIIETLKFPARELVELSEKLAISKELHKAGERKLLPERQTAVNQRVEIIEVGLQDAIEGLLARPLGAQSQIDFTKLGHEYQVAGDWFPFEITKGDLLFVVDDDGSVFISTENFPMDLFRLASNELESLAQQLYTI